MELIFSSPPYSHKPPALFRVALSISGSPWVEHDVCSRSEYYCPTAFLGSPSPSAHPRVEPRHRPAVGPSWGTAAEPGTLSLVLSEQRRRAEAELEPSSPPPAAPDCLQVPVEQSLCSQLHSLCWKAVLSFGSTLLLFLGSKPVQRARLKKDTLPFLPLASFHLTFLLSSPPSASSGFPLTFPFMN